MAITGEMSERGADRYGLLLSLSAFVAACGAALTSIIVALRW